MLDTMRKPRLSITKPENDLQKSLWSLIQDLKDGSLAKAPHQREFKWDKQKVLAWNRRIITAVTEGHGSRPTGVFVTYNVPGDNTVYLNDGFQRLSASELLLLDPKYYGLTTETATAILKAYDMPVQHRVFESHFDAMLDFQFINFGTPLTGYEFCSGYLKDMPNSDTNWIDFTNDLHKYMAEKLGGFKGPHWSAGTTVDTKAQFGLRQDYGLFIRYLTRNKSLYGGYATIGTKQPSISEVEGERTVEQRLRYALDEAGIEHVLNEFDSFRKFIFHEIENIMGILVTIRPEYEKDFSRSLMRFLLYVALYRRNNQIPEDAWKLFLIKLFRAMHTPGQVEATSGELPHKRLPLSERSINILNRVGDYIGFDITELTRNPKYTGPVVLQKVS